MSGNIDNPRSYVRVSLYSYTVQCQQQRAKYFWEYSYMWSSELYKKWKFSHHINIVSIILAAHWCPSKHVILAIHICHMSPTLTHWIGQVIMWSELGRGK